MATPDIAPFNKYIGNGATTQFSVGFPYIDTDFIHVYIKRADSDQEEVNTTDWEWVNETTIRFPATGSSEAILADGEVLVVQRETPTESEFTFANQKRLFPEDVMKADDLEMQILQEQARDLARAIKVEPTSPVDPEELVNEVERMYQSIDNIDTVAQNISDVNNVSDNMQDVNDCAENMEDIHAAPSAASSAATSASNAQTWAEGSDDDVSALGGTHSSKGWALQESNNYSVTATDSTASRVLKDRFADVLNVKDFGAKGDGSTDDTAAFTAAGSNVYVPAGEYKVTNLNNTNNLDGNGIIYCSKTGQKFCANGVELNKESIIGYPFFGWGDDVIFSNADRTPQGLAYVKDGDTERLFISLVVDTNEPQQARIVEFRIVDGVVQTDNVAYSEPLHIGHAQGMGATIEGGKIYLWSGSPTNYCISKIEWKGADTSDNDVQTIQILSSSGKYPELTYFTPTVSPDGKYLFVLSKGNQIDYTVLAFDASNIVTDDVKFAFGIRRSNPQVTVQGICADAKYVYSVESGVYWKKATISKYTYSGSYIGSVNAFENYTPDAGNITSQLEIESAAIYGDSLLTVTKLWEQEIADVVSFDGNNYACIESNTGASIFDRTYWQLTTAAANKGAWNPSTSYSAGNLMANYKIVSKVGKDGTGLWNLYNNNELTVTAYENVQVPFLRGHNLQFVAVNEKSTAKASEILASGDVEFYDLRYNTTGVPAGWMSNVSNSSGTQRTIFYGGDNDNTTNAGFVGLYGASDTNANNFAVTIGESSRKVVLDKTGTLRIKSCTDSDNNGKGIVISRATADNNDKATYLYHSSTTFRVRTNNTYLTLETCDSEDNVLGSVMITGDSSSGTMYPTTDDWTNLGKSSRRWKEVYAANATINTSDERQKQDIEDIDERVFRAWGKVNFIQYRFKDAVKEKGENARIHFGLIAQRVKEAFESEGLDGFKYGLLCYDEWGDEYEDVEIVDKKAEYDDEGNEISPAVTHTEKVLVTKAGNAYGIRYSEALALECAYLRWMLKK